MSISNHFRGLDQEEYLYEFTSVSLEGFVVFESGDRRNVLEQKVTWTGLCLRFAGRAS